MFCDNCENSAEDTSTTDTPDIDELKENLDQVCSKDPGVNFFMEFAQALGLENSDLFSWNTNENYNLFMPSILYTYVVATWKTCLDEKSIRFESKKRANQTSNFFNVVLKNFLYACKKFITDWVFPY